MKKMVLSNVWIGVAGLSIFVPNTAYAQMCSTTGVPNTVSSTVFAAEYREDGSLNKKSTQALKAYADARLGQSLSLTLLNNGQVQQSYALHTGAVPSARWIKQLDLSGQPNTFAIEVGVKGQNSPVSLPKKAVLSKPLSSRFEVPPINGQPMGPVDVQPLPKTLPSPFNSVPPTLPEDCLNGPEERPFHCRPSPPAPQGYIDITELKREIAEAIVLITFKRESPTLDGSYIFDVCNGTNLGRGKILTNQHCFSNGSKEHIVWFGEVEWADEFIAGPKKSDLACRGIKVESIAPKSPVNDSQLLDVAIIQLPIDEISNLDHRFLSSVVALPKSDIWCSEDGNCKPVRFHNRDELLSVAQSWVTDQPDKLAGDFSRNNIGGYRLGVKTLSDNRYFIEGSQACSASTYKSDSNENSERVSRAQLVNACAYRAKQFLNSIEISPYGFVHNCDTLPGSSGAPIFRQSDLDNYYSASIDKYSAPTLPLTAVHRAGDQNNANCAVPASLITKHMIPNEE